MDDQEFYQLLDKDGIRDDIHLFTEKLREWSWDPTQGQWRRRPVQARVLRFELGNLGDHKSVGEGVWEARVMFGLGYRMYFGKDGDAIIVLLVGGDKGSQAKDIARAQGFWRDYLETKKHGKTT